MSTQPIRLDTVYVQDNGDGFLDPKTDLLTNESGEILDPTSPEWVALTDKLKTKNLKGLWLSDVDFYLRRFEAAEAAAEKGDLDKVEEHLQFAVSYAEGTQKPSFFPFDATRADALRETAFLNSIRQTLVEYALSSQPMSLGLFALFGE